MSDMEMMDEIIAASVEVFRSDAALESVIRESDDLDRAYNGAEASAVVRARTNLRDALNAYIDARIERRAELTSPGWNE